MPKPRIFAVTLLLVISVVLAACGADDSADPTPEPTATRSPVLPTEMPGTTEIAEASPTATERATPTTSAALVATPAVATPAVGIQPVDAATATPVTVTEATPTVAATPPAVAATTAVQASPVVASPVPEVSTPVAVTLTLNGTEQVDYVVTGEGCVGLGQWRSLKPGAQVVVRDANGTVVDIATLEAGDDGCSWEADITAPGSEFVSISIPMVTEVWFTQADIKAGEVQLSLP